MPASSTKKLSVIELAPEAADLTGGKASGEDREIPGGDRARAELRRCEPCEDAETVRQDVKLAERENQEVR